MGRSHRNGKGGAQVHPRTETGDLTTAYEAEAVVAELTETIELQEAKIASLEKDAEDLRVSREQLLTRLVVAERWVEELANRLEAAENRLAANPWTLGARMGVRR